MPGSGIMAVGGCVAGSLEYENDDAWYFDGVVVVFGDDRCDVAGPCLALRKGDK